MSGYLNNVKGLKERLSNVAKPIAQGFAKEVEEKLTEKYKSLISDFYSDYTPVEYNRSNPGNLYKSFEKYHPDPRGSISYGGLRVSASRMKDYEKNNHRMTPISAEALLGKFIYVKNPPVTYHGGDMHGGYGERASFSIYEELENYRQDLIKEFVGRCGTRI